MKSLYCEDGIDESVLGPEPEKSDLRSWRTAGYFCSFCGDFARVDPEDGACWGCATCGFQTHAVAMHFAPNFDYAAATRSIALLLAEFCDDGLPYPSMIANAARRAAAEIERLRLSENGVSSPGKEL